MSLPPTDFKQTQLNVYFLICCFQLTPVLLGKHLTTYTFTKNLAENLVQKEVRNLPIAIVRPSMGEYKNHEDFSLHFFSLD